VADVPLAFGDDKRIRAVLLRLILIAQADYIVPRLDVDPAARCSSGGCMVLNAALVPPHARFQAVGCGIDGAIGVAAFAVRFKQKAAREMDRARGFEDFTLAFQTDVTVYFSRQKYLEDTANFVASVCLEGVADFEIFTSDLEGHENACSALTEAEFAVTERNAPRFRPAFL
jgi:hypothetical protein